MTRKSTNPKTNKPYKIVWFGDLITPTGFGRIGNEVTRRLHMRGWDVVGASISYTGWRHDFPFHVYPLANTDIYGGLANIVTTEQPDIIVSCQDFPYHQNIWQACRIDFSKIKWAWITPIDGTPIYPDWLPLTQYADGKMVISRFGKEAFRQAGYQVDLCHPGVDTSEFYPAELAERSQLRAKAGYNADDYIIGVVCMNQGRKAIPAMVEAFFEFAKDKPNARLYLDMDKTSPAGWDIPAMLTQMGLADDYKARVKYREDVFKVDMTAFAPLRNRYALLDAHMVISHREGFGLPLLESQACGLPTIALDWCSGPEIVGDGRGVLVKRIDYMERGTWGGSKDAFPDMRDFVAQLNALYANPTQAASIAQMGYLWACQQSWDVTANQVEATLYNAIKHERIIPPDARPDVTQPAANGISGHTVLQEPSPPVELLRESSPVEPDGGTIGQVAIDSPG